MFKWISNRVYEAFMAGIQRGVDQLAAPPAESLDLHEPRLLRLPASESNVIEDEATGNSKKRKVQA